MNYKPHPLDSAALTAAFNVEPEVSMRAVKRILRAYLSILPASGVPEAEAVAWRVKWRISDWIVTDDKVTAEEIARGGDRQVQPLYAAPSGDALAQAYRAGFKAGKVWAEPAPKVEP